MVNVLPLLVRHFRQHKQTQGNFFAPAFKQKFGSPLRLQFTVHNLPFIIFFLVFLILFAPAAVAQPADGAFYTTQLSDTLPRLAEKYLNNAQYAPAIAAATKAKLGMPVPDPLPPGFTLFIPDKATADRRLPTAEADAGGSGPPPRGKIAFGFYNRALARRVWEIDIISAADPSSGSEYADRQVYRWNEVSEPAISPDGTHLAFRGWAGDTGHVLSVGPLSGERFWPIGGFQEDSSPDWSHDGSRLVFASQRESDRLWRMYTIHADGQNERILARADGMPLFGESPAWSNRDDRIIYKGCSPVGADCGLWFITLDGAVSAPVIVDPTAIQPDGSPVADHLVFASMMSGNWEIYTVNIDGSDLRQLTNHPAIDALPTFSPDGEWIAFQSDRPGNKAEHPFEQGPSQGGQSTEANWGIWLIRADGTSLHQIFAFDGGQMKANRLDLPYGSRDWYDEQISWGGE